MTLKLILQPPTVSIKNMISRLEDRVQTRQQKMSHNT